ncbi:hypothetical protein [Streptomyces cacaoi]|uniref:hypothetical protein n=1 Tax=Streptomyces cacaoi TaxID=1898 RepID=UPI00374A7B26
MRIRHSRLTKDFLQVPNASVRDERLSHMARGILVDLLSRPDGWEATADGMWRASVKKHGDKSPGRRAFRAAFAELKECGYLTSSREIAEGGKYVTVLTIGDVPAGRTDVPHAGTSARSAETRKTAGETDVPHAGTSETPADVPHAGTSARPGKTDFLPAHADVPHGGTSASPAKTGIYAGRSDVPHAGTSNTEHGENTGKKTSSTAPDLEAFGAFWLIYPKSRDREKTLTEWRTAVANGADPQQITAAAEAYAREKAGEEWRYIKHSANWLRERRYEDDYAPAPHGKPQLRAVTGTSQHDIDNMTEEELHNALRFG